MNVQAILAILAALPLDQLKAELIPVVIAAGDKMFATGGFFVTFGWKVIRTFLESQEGAQAAHAALTK